MSAGSVSAAPSTSVPLWRRLWRGPRVKMGLTLLGVCIVMAIVGPLWVEDPHALVGRPLQPPSWAHWLGTSGQGQDVLAQTIWGTRRSLAIGFGVGLAVVVIGACCGIAAALFAGVIDAALSSLTQVVLVLPGLPLAIVVAAYLPSGPLTVVLVLTGWAWNARIVRSQALIVLSRDFVAAARVAGDSPWALMTTSILPNLSSLLLAQLVGSVTYAIGAEVGLGFLGLGDVSVVTWGTNLYWATNDGALLTGAWWTFVPSGLCIAGVGFALVLLSSGLDELSNPRLRSRAPWLQVVTAGGARVTDGTTPVVRSAPVADVTRSTASTQAPVPTLSIQDLSVSFVDDDGAVAVVDAVSFDVGPGEIVALVGESGSGKSTIAQAAMRLLPAPGIITGGAVTFQGKDLLSLDVDGLRALRWTQISWVMQSALDALNPVLTVHEQLHDVLAPTGLRGAAARARAEELMALVSLSSSVLDRYPHELSGGMRQRVAIAMALALSPSLVVLDEPTTALDVVVERDLLRELLSLRRQLGFAVLFIGHDLGRVVELADRVVVLYAGRVAEIVDAADFTTRSRHPYARLLLEAMPSLMTAEAIAPSPQSLPADPDVSSVAHRTNDAARASSSSSSSSRLPPSGCRFHPRCDRATSLCATSTPPLVHIGRDAIACHHPLER